MMTQRKTIICDRRELLDALFWMTKVVDPTHGTYDDDKEEYVHFAIMCLERALESEED